MSLQKARLNSLSDKLEQAEFVQKVEEKGAEVETEIEVEKKVKKVVKKVKK